MLGALPLLNELGELMSHLKLSKALTDQQALNDRIFGAFLTMPTGRSLLLTLAALAILPAVGEELFFRAVLFKLVSKRSRGIISPIVFTAIIFALAHLSIFNLPSIFLAGMLLAFIYYITGSLWCSILAHALFNGTQILITYGARQMPGLKRFAESGQNSAGFLFVAGVVFIISMMLLIGLKTPLSGSWTDDFEGETSPVGNHHLNASNS
jgi:membrane protease YdiL (CAAX protease family)